VCLNAPTKCTLISRIRRLWHVFIVLSTSRGYSNLMVADFKKRARARAHTACVFMHFEINRHLVAAARTRTF